MWQYLALLVRHALDNGYQEIELTKESGEAWLELAGRAPPMMIGTTECTPVTITTKGTAGRTA